MNLHQTGKPLTIQTMAYKEDTSEGYNQIAQWYNEITEGSAYGVDYVRKAINRDQAKNHALDVGCGVGGAIIEQLITSGYPKITGLDFASKMLGFARKRHPTVQFFETDFMDWPSQTEIQYSLIVAWDSLFHLPTTLQRDALKKLCMLLAPEGVLVVTGGGVEGDIQGKMNNVTFNYGSLSYIECLTIIEQCLCEIVTMEKDQEGYHMVYICQKKNPPDC